MGTRPLFTTKFRWLCVVSTLGLTACQPADVNVRSIRERLEAGEVIEYTVPGSIREICNKNKSDWTSIRVPREIREGIVLGKFVSVLGAGRYVCYRVGSVIDLDPSNESALPAGRAIVRRVALIRADRLEKYHLKGRAWASDETFQREKNYLLTQRLKAKDQGIAHIVDLAYIPGTAVDEKTLVDRENKGGNEPPSTPGPQGP